MIETVAYQKLWIEAQQWIKTNIREIAESYLESEDLANKFVHIAEKAYYTTIEDYFPNQEDQLGLKNLRFSSELYTLLSRIKTTDRYGYATAEIREYEQNHKTAS